MRAQPASLLPGDSSEPRQIFRARLPLDRLLSSPPGPHHENLIPNAFVARHGKRDGGESRTLPRPGAGGAPGKALVWGASGFEGHRRVGVQGMELGSTGGERTQWVGTDPGARVEATARIDLRGGARPQKAETEHSVRRSRGTRLGGGAQGRTQREEIGPS